MMKVLFAVLAISLLGLMGTSRADEQTFVKPYALAYCVYSGDKLGEMGKVQKEIYKDQEIKFCCNDCKKQFDKDRDAGLKKYNAAVKDASGGPIPKQ